MGLDNSWRDCEHARALGCWTRFCLYGFALGLLTLALMLVSWNRFTVMLLAFFGAPALLAAVFLQLLLRQTWIHLVGLYAHTLLAYWFSAWWLGVLCLKPEREARLQRMVLLVLGVNLLATAVLFLLVYLR